MTTSTPESTIPPGGGGRNVTTAAESPTPKVAPGFSGRPADLRSSPPGADGIEDPGRQEERGSHGHSDRQGASAGIEHTPVQSPQKGAKELMRRALSAAENFRQAETKGAREMARRTMWSAYREWTALWFPSMTAAELDAAAAKFEAGVAEVYG